VPWQPSSSTESYSFSLLYFYKIVVYFRVSHPERKTQVILSVSDFGLQSYKKDTEKTSYASLFYTLLALRAHWYAQHRQQSAYKEIFKKQT